MQILVKLERFHALPAPLVLAAGFFDGVHRGHQAVLEGAVRHAREIGGQAWALTFDQHPRSVLDPEHAPPLITPLPMRLERLQSAGLDGTFLLHFQPELAALPPAEFIRRLSGESRAIAEIRCGENWRFGARAAGTPGLLAELGRDLGFGVVVVPAVDAAGEPISSTRIRHAVLEGRLEDATAMLGRPHTIRETVVHGRQLARSFGVATANFSPNADLLPPVGVYAVSTSIGGRKFNGIGSLGWRPTFKDARPDKPVLEVHLFDFDGNLYGATLDIAFHTRIRDERRFPTPEALFAQIRRDIGSAKSYFAKP